MAKTPFPSGFTVISIGTKYHDDPSYSTFSLAHISHKDILYHQLGPDQLLTETVLSILTGLYAGSHHDVNRAHSTPQGGRQGDGRDGPGGALDNEFGIRPPFVNMVPTTQNYRTAKRLLS